MPIHALHVHKVVIPTVNILEEVVTTLSWPLCSGPLSGRAFENENVKCKFGGVVDDIVLTINNDSIGENFGVIRRSGFCWICMHCGLFFHLQKDWLL